MVGAAVPPHVAMANRFFVAVFLWLLLFSIGLAPWYGAWTLVFLVALPTALLPILSMAMAPGALWSRMTVAAALMVFCGLNIDQSHGMIELHFGVFVLLSLLLIYQDWQVIIGAAAVIAVHHFYLIICRRRTIAYGFLPRLISPWFSSIAPMWWLSRQPSVI